MVAYPTPFTCLTVILLEFTCQVSKSGPVDEGAKSELYRVSNNIAKIQFSSFHYIGVVSGRQNTLALLIDHRPIREDSGYYNERNLPHVQIRQMETEIGTLRSVLMADPVLTHVITGMLYWSLLHSTSLPLRSPIVLDLIRVDVQNDYLASGRERADLQDPRLAIDDPLSQLWFVESCLNHINRTSRKIGCTRAPMGALQRCSTVHTLTSYLTRPHVGDTTEQLCIIDWKSEKDRKHLQKGSWWNRVFQKELRVAQMEGKALDAECISIVVHELHRYPPSTAPAASASLASARRWLADVLCFHGSK